MPDASDNDNHASSAEVPRRNWVGRFVDGIKRRLEERRAKKKEEGPTDRAARSAARATWVIAFFTIILAVATCLTLWEIHTGGADTHSLAVAAGNQATWTQRLATSADTQSGYMKDLAARTKDVADQALIQAKEAKVSADAAEKLADLTAKQFAASQQLIESQRASISISFARVINPITFHDGAPSIVFSILIQNTGAIKATDVAVRFKPYYSQWGQSIFTEPLVWQRDFCAAEQPSPPTWGWENGRKIDLKGLSDWTFTVEPHTPFERELNFGMAKPTDADIIKWPPSDAIQRSPNPAVTDRIFPVVVGCVDYRSGAMPERHQTGFIFEVQESYPNDPANAVPTLVHCGVDLPRERVVVTQFFFGQGKRY